MRFALIVSLLAGVAGYHYSAPASASATLRTTDGVRIALQDAGSVDWTGPGMTGVKMAVVCGKNALVFGLLPNQAVALNGYSASWRHDGGHIMNAKGAKLPIVTGDKRDLVMAGLVTTDADPMTFNAKSSEGLDIGRRTCPF